MDTNRLRELDHRRGDGLDVTLWWDQDTNRVLVAVRDERFGESLEFDVPAAEAREAFRHPYACRGSRPACARGVRARPTVGGR